MAPAVKMHLKCGHWLFGQGQKSYVCFKWSSTGRWGWNCWLENECFSTHRFRVNSSLCLVVLVETKMIVIVSMTLKRLKKKDKQTKKQNKGSCESFIKIRLGSSSSGVCSTCGNVNYCNNCLCWQLFHSVIMNMLINDLMTVRTILSKVFAAGHWKCTPTLKYLKFS